MRAIVRQQSESASPTDESHRLHERYEISGVETTAPRGPNPSSESYSISLKAALLRQPVRYDPRPLPSPLRVSSLQIHLGRFEHGGDALNGIGDFFVLPHSDNSPPCVRKKSVGGFVAFAIPPYFRTPILRVRLGRDVMVGASVPIATVNHDSDPLSREDNVGPGSLLGDWPEINSITT